LIPDNSRYSKHCSCYDLQKAIFAFLYSKLRKAYCSHCNYFYFKTHLGRKTTFSFIFLRALILVLSKLLILFLSYCLRKAIIYALLIFQGIPHFCVLESTMHFFVLFHKAIFYFTIKYHHNLRLWQMNDTWDYKWYSQVFIIQKQNRWSFVCFCVCLFVYLKIIRNSVLQPIK
jgi:hypothetical protein